MDFNTFIEGIANVGFPIVSWVALFWYVVKQNETLDKLSVTIAELKQLIENMKGE